ncbi:hypothetical protein AGMMS49543_24060 [Betaproteobacteria bacterium]|nr:hypothetical protein AGMMS49543_24060 [Betaproteobacteria bacterium]GHU18889.1 hypothetical protein AGMMS50243_09760 [Betaproteobacteria bacterium]
MVIDMNDEKLRTLVDLQGFLDATDALDFKVSDDERYGFTARTVKRFGDSSLKRGEKAVKHGRCVGKERVRKQMALHGIQARHKRKYIATTNLNHHLPVAPNLLKRNFVATAPNQVWTSDITYCASSEGWVYLAVIIDLFSRQVVGWSMQPHMKAELVADALRMVWFRRCRQAGVIVHSDRGSQYCSGLFQDALKAYMACVRQ